MQKWIEKGIMTVKECWITTDHGMELSDNEYLEMRKAQGLAGEGKSTLRSWVHRKVLMIDDVSGKYVKINK